jgi:hypothetical protein
MSFLKDKRTAVGVMFLVGFICIVELFFPTIPGLSTSVDYLSSWIPLLINLSAIIGTYSLLRRNIRAIQEKREEYWLNGWLIIFWVLVIATFIATGSINSVQYTWLYDNVYANLQSGTMALLGFYILLSAARAFRARNIEVGIMIIGAIFVFFTNATIGGAIWSGFPTIGNWFLNVPVFGTSRAISITAGVGTIIMGVRILLGDEKTILG